MTIRVTDVFTEVRRIIQDEDATKRHSDNDLRSALKNALATARRVRPDLFLADLAALPDVTGSTLPIEEQFISPLVFITAGLILASNDEFIIDGAARNLMRQGQDQLSRNA